MFRLLTQQKAAQPVAAAREISARPRAEKRSLWHRWHLGALLTHVGLSVLVTWPLVLNFLPGAGTLVPGFMLEDRDQNLWNLWWVHHALSHGKNPFITDMIWYPTPVSLYYHTLNIFNGLLAFPLLGFLPLTTVYNLVVLFSFVMAGYGAFLLVEYVCRNRWAALVGSVVFAYSAYHISTMRSLLQLISLEWVPFFVLFFLQAIYQPRWSDRREVVHWLWRRALPAGFSLFLVSLVDWYYTLYSLMLAGLIALYVLLRPPRDAGAGDWLAYSRAIGQPLVRMAAPLLIYAVLISPILVPTVQELRRTSYMMPAPDSALSNSADLLTFFQPPRWHHLWGRFFTGWLDWPFANNPYEVYFTYTALFLAGVALVAGRLNHPRPAPDAGADVGGLPRYYTELPGKWFWAACVLLFFLLALGPVLQVNGHQLRWLVSPDWPLVMPYQLVGALPVFNITRSPDRFDMPLTLCLALLAAYGVNVLMNSWWKALHVARRGAIIALGAVALILVELTPFPYPQVSADIPPWYHQLGRESGDFSILELPPQNDYWHGAYRMYFQTAHEKPIFGGYISREYPHPFLESTPGYQELTYVDGGGDMFQASPDRWYTAFERWKTRYIVLQKDKLPDDKEPPVDVSESRSAIERVLGGARPFYTDQYLEVYRVPAPGRKLPFLQVGEGWEPRESGPNGTFRWMRERATMSAFSNRRQDAYLVFRATGLGGADAPKRLRITHGDYVVFDGTVEGLKEYRLGPLGLPTGESLLTLTSLDGTTSPLELGLSGDPRRLSFALLDVRLEPAGD